MTDDHMRAAAEYIGPLAGKPCSFCGKPGDFADCIMEQIRQDEIEAKERVDRLDALLSRTGIVVGVLFVGLSFTSYPPTDWLGVLVVVVLVAVLLAVNLKGRR